MKKLLFFAGSDKSMSKLITLTMAFACLSASNAAEIMFSGTLGTKDSPVDISLNTNWPNDTLPTKDDLIVFDMSDATGDRYITLSSPLEVKGVRIRRTVTSRKSFIVDKVSKLLSIGGEGVLASNVHFVVNAPIAVTSSDSTWQFAGGEQLFTTYSTISGPDADAVLTIKGVSHYIYTKPPNFPGTLVYTDGGCFVLQTSGTMAKEVKVLYGSSNPDQTLGLTSASNEWSTVFASGVYRHKAWAGTKFGRGNSTGAYPLLVYREGDVFDAIRSDNGGPQYNFRINNGTFRQAGGTYVGGSFTWVGGTADAPAELQLFGGSYTVDCLYHGYGSSAYRYVPTVTQRDGATVTFKTTAIVGASGCAVRGIAEYAMEGGTLAINGSSSNWGLILSGNTDGGVNNGVFTQRGGTATTRAVSFGAMKKMWSNDVGEHEDGFGMLDLAGGQFTVSTSNGFRFGPAWNRNGGESSYRISLHGGTLKTSTDLTVTNQIAFPPTETAGTWDDGGKQVTMNAPIYGTGHFRKTGAGTMFLEDATRFTGTLEVDEGVLVLPSSGTPDGEIGTAGCLFWSADELAKTLDDGAAITSWADVNGGVTAVSNVNIKAGSYGVPKLAKNALNGHAAVRFGRSVLTIPRTENPLVAQSNLTFVCVLRNNGDGNGSKDYEWAYCHAPFGNMGVPTDGTVSGPGRFAFSYYGGSRYAFGISCNGMGENYATAVTLSPLALNDSKVHVAIGVKCGAELSLYVDGSLVSHQVVKGNNSCNYALFCNEYGTRAPQELHFGLAQTDDIATGSDTRSYQGWISEIRFYTNRVFTVAEQQKLGRYLLDKYAGASDAAALLKKNIAYSPAEPGVYAKTVETPPAVKPATARWTASSLTGADGASVASWTSDDGERSAVAGGQAPVLVRTAVGGRAAVRFGGASKLTLAAADSPVSGKSDFAVAVVFRADVDGMESVTGAYFQASGLVSSWQGANGGSADLAVGLCNQGTFVAGTGFGRVFRRNPCRLADGLPHVAIFNCNPSAGTYATMVDGVYGTTAVSTATAQGAFDILFGSTDAGCTQGFNGDIAEIAFYDAALTKAEMTALSEAAAQTYGFRTAGKNAWTELTAGGLSARNVVIGANGALRTSLSDDDDERFTIGEGESIELGGRVVGALTVDDATIVVPVSGTCGCVDDLKLSGHVTIKVPAGYVPPEKSCDLLNAGKLTIADGTTLTLSGLSPEFRVLVKDGRLVLKHDHGLLLLVR